MAKVAKSSPDSSRFYHLDLLVCVGLVQRLVLHVAGFGIGCGGHHNLRQVVAGLDQVELRLVGVVVRGDVGVGDGDLGRDLLVDYLFDGDITAELTLQVVHRQAAFFHALFELLLSVGRLDFAELAVDLFLGGQQAELFRLLHHDLVVDELLQDGQAQAGGFLGAGLLWRLGGLHAVVFLDIGAQDLLAVDLGHGVPGTLLGAAPGQRQRREQREEEESQCAQMIAIQQLASHKATGIVSKGAACVHHFAGVGADAAAGVVPAAIAGCSTFRRAA